MLLNFSNHKSSNWSEVQIKTANKLWGDIVDFPFPAVSSSATKEDIEKMATEITSKIEELCPSAVMCQGEFTLAFSVANKLKEKGITVVAACSDRVVEEILIGDHTEKRAIFKFVQFREY